MKSLILAPVVWALMLCSLAAQEETAAHRALYQSVNDAVATMRKSTARHKGEEGETQLTGWLDDSGVRKLEARQGGVSTEYYLDGGEPVFVYRVTQGEDGAKTEERLYFRDGEIFKWLTTEKNAPVFHAEDYEATTKMHVVACREFVSALTKGKKGDPAVGARLEGVFLGLEQGDYTHWKIRLKDGSERSFFVLQTTPAMEKALEDPKKFSGRSCRVGWKKSMEELPEAGGKVEVEKLVSVEWLK